jgi:hypothetical protein
MPETVKYLEMRNELIDYLRELEDFQHQNEYWVKRRGKTNGGFSNFDEAVHFLFDDAHLASDSEGCIGFFLLNNDEAKAVKKLTGLLDRLIDEHKDKNDEFYISLPEWKDVLKLAQDALGTLTGD